MSCVSDAVILSANNGSPGLREIKKGLQMKALRYKF